MTQTRAFGRTPDGSEVLAIRIGSGDVSAGILTLGATVHRLEVDGVNIVLGHQTVPEYLGSPFYMGATCGRFANRIGGARFDLDGVTHQLPANENGNLLHGGADGFDKRVWTIDALADDAVELTLHSPDGDQGFPGNLYARARYEVDADSLTVTYSATTDAPTVVNLTTHVYFNADGEDAGSTDPQLLRLASRESTAVDDALIPTGRLVPVNVPYGELRTIAEWAPLDTNFVLDPFDNGVVAALHSPTSGLTIDVLTDQPGLQIYTADALSEAEIGTSGAPYVARAGIAVETQNFPDAPNHPNFPGSVLRPGEVYSAMTTWRFTRPAP